MEIVHARSIKTVLVIFILALSFVSIRHGSAATSNIGLIIPLYIYPGTTWQTVIQERQANPSTPIVVIINPDNGPGSSMNLDYKQGIQELQSSGVVVIGYVHTSYGVRNATLVESEISTYKTWYGVNGIFFDEMANSPGFATYYSTLTGYARSIGLLFIVGNPGTPVPSSYIGMMNVFIIYESTGLPVLVHLLVSSLLLLLTISHSFHTVLIL